MLLAVQTGTLPEEMVPDEDEDLEFESENEEDTAPQIQGVQLPLQLGSMQGVELLALPLGIITHIAGLERPSLQIHTHDGCTKPPGTWLIYDSWSISTCVRHCTAPLCCAMPAVLKRKPLCSPVAGPHRVGASTLPR